ncbi:MAG TPA: hypothetical protein VF602_06980 [Pedobacter sp.]
MKIEEMIDLLEIAAVNVDRFDDIRIHKYQSRARALLDSVMTFEETSENLAEAVGRLEAILRQLSRKIKMRENYQFVIRQLNHE